MLIPNNNNTISLLNTILKKPYNENWNPLVNNQDAFEILVDLGLKLEYTSISIEPDRKTLVTLSWVPGGLDNKISYIYGYDQDPYALTRSIIVEAVLQIYNSKLT